MIVNIIKLSYIQFMVDGLKGWLIVEQCLILYVIIIPPRISLEFPGVFYNIHLLIPALPRT